MNTRSVQRTVLVLPALLATTIVVMSCKLNPAPPVTTPAEPELRAAVVVIPPQAPKSAEPAAAGPGPAGRNLALGKPTVANNHIYAFTADKAVDGDLASYYEGAASAWPNEITIDLGSTRDLGSVVLKLNPKRIWSERTQEIAVYGSTDGSTFSVAVASQPWHFDPATGNTVTISLALSTRYLRLGFTSNTGSGAGQVSEIEIYSN